MVRLLAYLAGLPLCLLPTSNLHTLLKSININIRWPTSLTGGERTGGNEFGC